MNKNNTLKNKTFKAVHTTLNFKEPEIQPVNGYYPEDIAIFIQEELNIPQQIVYDFLNARTKFYGSDCFDKIKDDMNIQPKQLRRLLKAEQHFINAING